MFLPRVISPKNVSAISQLLSYMRTQEARYRVSHHTKNESAFFLGLAFFIYVSPILREIEYFIAFPIWFLRRREYEIRVGERKRIARGGNNQAIRATSKLGKKEGG